MANAAVAASFPVVHVAGKHLENVSVHALIEVIESEAVDPLWVETSHRNWPLEMVFADAFCPPKQGETGLCRGKVVQFFADSVPSTRSAWRRLPGEISYVALAISRDRGCEVAQDPEKRIRLLSAIDDKTVIQVVEAWQVWTPPTPTSHENEDGSINSEVSAASLWRIDRSLHPCRIKATSEDEIDLYTCGVSGSGQVLSFRRAGAEWVLTNLKTWVA